MSDEKTFIKTDFSPFKIAYQCILCESIQEVPSSSSCSIGVCPKCKSNWKKLIEKVLTEEVSNIKS